MSGQQEPINVDGLGLISNSVAAEKAVTPIREDSATVPSSVEGFVPGVGLPSIPGSLVSRIRKGEFVELGELLPEYIGEVFLQSQTGKGLKGRPPMIHKPVDWLVAFSTYMLTVVAEEPARAMPLIKYQASVMRLVRDFGAGAWLVYDRSFRQKAAASSDVDWGKIDIDLWSLAINSASRHSAGRDGAYGATRQFSSCDAWNLSRCFKHNCIFPHVCAICGHPSHRSSQCGHRHMDAGGVQRFRGPPPPSRGVHHRSGQGYSRFSGRQF